MHGEIYTCSVRFLRQSRLFWRPYEEKLSAAEPQFYRIATAILRNGIPPYSALLITDMKTSQVLSKASWIMTLFLFLFDQCANIIVYSWRNSREICG